MPCADALRGAPAEGRPKGRYRHRLVRLSWVPDPAFSRTLFLRKAELTEDKNYRTYRTAPMEPGSLEFEEQEREKEERSWDMLRNLEISRVCPTMVKILLSTNRVARPLTTNSSPSIHIVGNGKIHGSMEPGTSIDTWPTGIEDALRHRRGTVTHGFGRRLAVGSLSQPLFDYLDFLSWC